VKKGVAALAFLLFAAAGHAGETRIQLRETQKLPLVEAAGPFSGRVSQETLAGTDWRPQAAGAPAGGNESYYFASGPVFDLSGRFLPVTGRLYLRVRVLPVSDGERTLAVSSYHKAASVLDGGTWRQIDDVTRSRANTFRLAGRKDTPLTIYIETTPLFSSCSAAITWSGAEGDELIVSGSVEQAVLDAMRITPEQKVIDEAGVRGAVTLAIEWPADAPGSGEIRVEAPDGAEQRVARGAAAVRVGLPARPFAGTAFRTVFHFGAARREVLIPHRAGITAEIERLRGIAETIPLHERKRHALFLLRVDQLADETASVFISDWKRVLGRLEEAKAAWEAGPGDFYGTKPGFREEAYVSEVDLSPQPYLLYVPAKAPARYPLVVYLHGYVPDYRRADWIGPRPMDYLPCEEAGAIYAAPFARSNTDFLTVGETDVLDVIDEIKRRFPVDEERVYLMGYSMGGSGVWTLTTHYPDIWAAALVLSGRTDYYYWQNLDRAGLSPWLNAMILSDNPIDLAENIAHLPVLIFHGDADWVVKSGHSTRMFDKLKALGAPAEFHWIRGADHWRAGVVLYNDEVMKRLLSFTRARPAKITRKAYLTKYASWRGIEVLAPRDVLAPIAVSADFDAGAVSAANALFVKTPAGMSVAGMERVGEAEGAAFWASGEWTNGGKSPYRYRQPGFSGTFRDLTSRPFALVYGTSGRRAGELEAAACRFAAAWKDFTDSPALVFADNALPAGMERSRSLILFGEAAENLWAARAAPCVPFSVRNNIVAIGDVRRALGPDDGYIITYPSPFARSAYVAFCGTVSWGERLSVNHKFDFVPDITIFRRGGEGFQGSDEYLEAGFFDAAWRVDGKLIFRGHLKP